MPWFHVQLLHTTRCSNRRHSKLHATTVAHDTTSYAEFRLRARSDRVDRSDTIATIATETLSYPSRDRSDRIATIAEA